MWCFPRNLSPRLSLSLQGALPGADPAGFSGSASVKRNCSAACCDPLPPHRRPAVDLTPAPRRYSHFPSESAFLPARLRTPGKVEGSRKALCFPLRHSQCRALQACGSCCARWLGGPRDWNVTRKVTVGWPNSCLPASEVF